MRLLLDQNLSHRLVPRLPGAFAGSAHVRDVRLDRAEDAAIWLFARDRGLAILSKDDDFFQRSMVFGHPPKVIWLRLGNCPTAHIGAAFIQWTDEILAFGADAEQSLMVIFPSAVLRH